MGGCVHEGLGYHSGYEVNSLDTLVALRTPNIRVSGFLKRTQSGGVFLHPSYVI